MRKSYLFLLVTVFAGTFMSAQVKIGDNPQNIDPSSVLELESTDKVLVITRVTTAQMNAIVPSQGALCFNTDLQSVHYYDGTQWVNIGGSTGTGGPLTADPIVNTQPTIVITPTATGDNLEVAPNSIRSEQIVDGGVNGVDIQDGSIGPGKLQDFSITQEKLSENSVGAFALDNDSFGVSAFNNDVGYLTAADLNLVSGDVGNVLENRVDGVFYNDQFLIDAVNQNTDAIALDADQSAANEIQNPTLTGTEIGLTGTAGTIDIGPLISGGGSDDQNLGPAALDGSNMLTINIEGGNPTTVDLSPLASGATADGSETIINPTATITVAGTGTTLDPYELTAIGGAGGTTEVVDGTTLTGTGTGIDPFKIEPGVTGQVLTTDATGVVWANAAPGGGSTEEADQITITGVGTNADPFKIEPGADGQVLVTSGAAVTWAAPPATGSTEEADQTTITGVGTNADPFKIEPSITNGQFLRTDVTGNVIWDDLPAGTGGAVTSDGVTIVGTGADVASALSVPTDGITDVQIANGTILAEDLNNMGATDGQVLKWDNATTSWILAADDTGAAALTDGNIFVGDATNTPQDVTLAGDATIDNVGVLTIADDAITLAKIDQNGATDGQIMKWDDATTSWVLAADDTGSATLTDGNIFVGDATNAPQDVPLSGDATIDNLGALTIADDAITLAKINQNGAADGQVMKWDDATTSWVLAADDTGSAALTDGNIFVGDATNTPQDVTLSGDATIDNMGVIMIADDAVTLPKIDQNGATDGQVMKWDDATTSWVLAADDTGLATLTDGNIFVGDATNTPQDVTLSGDATIDNMGVIMIADDAVNTNKIENAAILAEDLNSMGATADGEILQWDTALNAGAGGWEVAANGGHTGTANEIFFADALTGAPTSDNGLIWNPTAITGGFEALGIGLDGGPQSAKAKVHIAETLDGLGNISYGLELQNRAGNIGNAVGIIFAVDPTLVNGKGALLYERTGTGGIGDFHFLQSTGGTGNPAITDKAFTITNDKHLGIYGGIDIGGAGTGFGTANQVLASGGAGNPVQWVNAGGSGDNLSTTNLAQPLTDPIRTYNIPNATQSLIFTGLGNVGVGNGANPPQNKFHVAGAIRSEGFLNSNGDKDIPSYRFSGDVDTGMFWRAADEIGFSVGTIEAASIQQTGATSKVVINQSLELDGTLIDTGGQAGTAGQVLSSTVTGTDWVNPSGPAQKEKVPAVSPYAGAGPGDYTVPVNGQSNADYIINVSVKQNSFANAIIIQIVSQSQTDFSVRILEWDNASKDWIGMDADWHYTIYNP